jgi:hypothetical protein
MSIESVSWALNYDGPQNLSQTQKLVLIGIANHDGDGGAWPAIATLARYAAVGERSVQRAIKDLEILGLVTVETNGGGTLTTRNDRRPNRYILNRHGVTQDVTPSESRGDSGDTHGVTLGAERGDTAMSPEPSMNHPQEPLPTSSTDSLPVVPDGTERDPFMGTFDDWYATYPRKQGKDAAQRGWKRLPADQRAACIKAQPLWNAYWAARNEPQFIPMASTWISQRRWNDDVPTTIQRMRPVSKHERNKAVFDEFLARKAQPPADRTPLGLPKGPTQ